MPNPKPKPCSKCNETKDLHLFTRNKRCKDGYAGVCLACAAIRQQRVRDETGDAYNKQWRKDHKDQINEYAKQWNIDNQQYKREYNRKRYHALKAKQGD